MDKRLIKEKQKHLLVTSFHFILILFVVCSLSFQAHSAQLNLNTTPNPPAFTSDQTFSGNTGSGTAGYGVFVSTLNTGNVNLAGYTINSTGNLYGFNALTAGTMNITGGSVNASDNQNAARTSGWGIFSSGVNATDISNIIRSTINMTDISSLNANNNAVYGIDSEAGALINLSGTGAGSSFSAQENKNTAAAGTWNNGYGIYAAGANSANLNDIKQSTVEVKNFDNINTSGNGLYGTYANTGGSISIEGATEASSFVSNGNKNQTGVNTWTNGYGVYANGANSANPSDVKPSTVSISNIKTFDANQNGQYGIASAASGNVVIEGTASTDSVLNAIGNITSAGAGGAGMHSTGANSSITIKGMQTINTSQNGLYGIHSAAEGSISIEGTGGDSSSFNAIGNKNLAGANGAGVFSTGANSSVSIKDMQSINVSQNGLYGIHSAAGGSISIEGTADSDSVFNAIGNTNLAGSNGYGIFSTGANSSISIKGMETINSVQNGMYGISAAGGGSVTIEGTGITTVNLSENKRTDGAVEGVGLYVTGAGTTVNISQVETFNANDNGRYGLHFVNTGATTTDIAGNGSAISSFNVNNNGGIGFLHSGANHTINLSGFKNYNFNDNGGAGFSSANSTAVLTIEGVSSGSEITASRNAGAGFTTAVTSAVVLKNITKMEATDNAGSGIVIGSNVSFQDMSQGISFISTGNTGASSDGLSINGTHNLSINELTINNNGRYGMSVVGGSTTFDMSDNAFYTHSNGGHGLYVTASTLTLDNLAGIYSTDNGGDGINISATGTLNINGNTGGTSLIVNDNNGMGLNINAASSVVFDNITYFEAQRNGTIGLKFTANTQFMGIDDGIGFLANGNTTKGIEIAGNHSFDKVTQFSVNNNGSYGLHVISGSTSLGFDENAIFVTDNGNHGIYVQAGALELKNISGGVFSNNGASGFTVGGAAVANIEGLNSGSTLIAEGNGGHGLFFSGTGTLKNITRIEARDNNNYGFNIGSGMTWEMDDNKEVSLIAINNGLVSGSYYGMAIGVTIDNIVEMIATDNGVTGAVVLGGGVANVTGNADFSRNTTIGLRLASGSTFNMTNSTPDTHYFIASDTAGTGSTMGVDVHGGRLNLDNVNVILHNQAYGIINWYSGITSITNSNFDVRDNSYGILSSIATTNITSLNGARTFYGYNNMIALATQEGGILNIDNMNLYLENNQYGLRADFGGGLFTVTGSGQNQMVLKNNTQYGMSVEFNSQRANTPGIMTIDNMTIIAEGNDLAKIMGDGSIEESITIKNSTINMLTNNNLFATENFGTYFLDNVQSFGGNLLLSSTGSGTSEFTAKNSNLSGGITTSGLSVSNVLFEGSEWNMKTSSNMTSLENNASKISLKSSVPGMYNNLTVSDYNGTNGEIYLNTFFDSVGTNTDKLVINGTASGNSVLFITGTGTDNTQSQNGIKVVDASSGTTSAGNFSLNGGVFDAYGYEYRLFRGGLDGLDENSFFLRGTGRSSAASTAVNLPALHLNIVQTGTNELRKRMGDIRNNRTHDNGLWVRTYAKNLTVDDTVESKMNLFGLEAGYDRQTTIFDEDVYLGLMIGYIDGSDIKTYQKNGYTGRSETQTPSFGVYGTWLNDDGWFVDGTMRYFQVNMDVTSYTSTGSAIKYEPNRNFIALSLEAGRTMKYEKDDNSTYIVEPKFEVQYAHSNSETFRTNSGYDVSYGQTQSFATKAGVLLGYEKTSDKEQIFTPFVEFNISQEWDGKTNIRYAGTPFESDLQGISFGISTGLNAKLDENISVFSDISYEKGTAIEAFGINLGLRYSF